jgi:hypothetical protein
MSNGLQKYTDEQARFITDAQAEQYKIAYNRGVAAILRKQELNMIHNTVQPTMMGGGSKANAMPLGFTDNVDYQALVTGGKKKVNRLKKAKAWTDYSSDLFDTGLSKAKAVESLGMGISGGKKKKVNRLKKANQWTSYASDLFDTGLEKAKKVEALGAGKVNRKKKADQWTAYASDLFDTGIDKAKKVKSLAGSGAPRKPSAWILHVKKYAAEHNVSYKQAMKEASATYKK